MWEWIIQLPDESSIPWRIVEGAPQCIAMASSEGIGSSNRPKRFIFAERLGLCTIKELYIEEPLSHAMDSSILSSKLFWCHFNSLGIFSLCLTKLSITLLKPNVVISTLLYTLQPKPHKTNLLLPSYVVLPIWYPSRMHYGYF